jgi:hypothetical protein
MLYSSLFPAARLAILLHFLIHRFVHNINDAIK